MKPRRIRRFGAISTEHVPPKDSEPRKDIYAELYSTLNNQGAEAAMDRYLVLKAEHEDEYDFNEFVLLAAGSKLLAKDRAGPASAFLRLDPGSGIAAPSRVCVYRAREVFRFRWFVYSLA